MSRILRHKLRRTENTRQNVACFPLCFALYTIFELCCPSVIFFFFAFLLLFHLSCFLFSGRLNWGIICVIDWGVFSTTRVLFWVPFKVTFLILQSGLPVSTYTHTHTLSPIWLHIICLIYMKQRETKLRFPCARWACGEQISPNNKPGHEIRIKRANAAGPNSRPSIKSRFLYILFACSRRGHENYSRARQ